MTTRDLLVRHEGCRHHSYDDATGKDIIDGVPLVGNATIGIGCRCEPRPITWTDADIEDAYANHLHEILSALRTHAFWFLALDPVRQAAVLSIAWNVGTSGMLAFTHMIAGLKAQAWNLAADEALDSDAARQLPTRYHEIAAMLRTGDWPT